MIPKFFIGGLLIATATMANAAEATLAFPDAAGWGRLAKGARGAAAPTVYHVTNLNDSGSGSLRDAVSQPGRIVVFDVSGVIKITSRMVFSKNLLIAGQTAPGEGITVYGNGVSFSGADNIIVRYLRIRMGHNGTSGKDAAGIANGGNMIFDHCSFSWGLDETFSINPDNKGTTPHNITLQNCIFGQGLLTHSAGGLMQSDSITLYRNLYIDNSTRNNKIKGINQYANNVVYNWQNGCYIMGGDSEGESFVNIQSNLFINGPAKGGNCFGGANSLFHCYGDDNWQDSNLDGQLNPSLVTDYSASDRVSTPYNYPELELYSGKQLIEKNIPTVGASLPYRDQSDCYMIDELMSFGKNGGIISNEANLPIGAPSTWQWWAGEKTVDTDGDGMPDAWEAANGTDPNKADATVKAANGYLNIENYINSITADDRQYFLRAPITLQKSKATTTSVTLAWRDYTYAEEGFKVEYAKQGTTEYTVAGTTKAGGTSFTVTGLTPETVYDFRVYAVGHNNGTETKSDYATITVGTVAMDADLVDIDTYQPDRTMTKPDEWVWNKQDEGGWDELKPFADGNNVLFNNSSASNDMAVTVESEVNPAAIVVKGAGNVTLKCDAPISGTASVNKTGEGTLTLEGDNKYTGTTVAYDGVVAFNSIADGGIACALGAAADYSKNWIFDGGEYRYTGTAAAATNRNAQLRSESTLSVENAKAVLTMNGTMEGKQQTEAEGLTIDGEGQINVGTTNFFGYKGATTLKGGTLYLSTVDIAKNGIGSSSKLIMAGGKLKTAGEQEGYETYTFPMQMEEGTYSYFAPNRNCYIKSKLTGAGTLEFQIPYLREYFNCNVSDFTGKIVANGIGSDAAGSLFLHQTNFNMPNTQVTLKGNAVMCMWTTNGTGYVGGLSGDKGTYLSASSKNTKTAVCSWIIGSANSDETFNGIINNRCCANKYNAKTNNINKVGTGYWRLNGNNTYTGATIISAGSIILNGTHSGQSAYTVANGATLCGMGSVSNTASTITVNSGGTLLAGDPEGELNGKKLTLKGAVTMKSGSTMQVPVVNNNNTKYGQNNFALTALTIADDVTLDIDMTNVQTPLEAGNYFTVFATVPTTLNGTFENITPLQPAEGLYWDASDLYTTGRLKIVNTPTAINSVSAQQNIVGKRQMTIDGTPVSSGYRGIVVADGKKLLSK